MEGDLLGDVIGKSLLMYSVWKHGKYDGNEDGKKVGIETGGNFESWNRS